MNKVLVGLLLAGLFFLSGLNRFVSADQTKVLNVLATNSILDDAVRQVAGDFVNVKVLVGPNGDPHTFEPTPQDNVLLKNAQIIFENSLYLEPWMDKLYKASQSQARRVRVTDGIKLIEKKDGHDDADEHKHFEFDPHVWHDVKNMDVMVVAVRDALIKEDPQHAAGYQKNAQHYLSKLTELDRWITEQVSMIPEDNRQLVTSHDTFSYFARRYGFKIVGAVVDSATTEAADPSALKIADLVKKIKSANVKAVFIENVANPQMVQAVASEAGVKVAPFLYSDALGEKGSAGENYIEMMRYNVRTIVEALK